MVVLAIIGILILIVTMTFFIIEVNWVFEKLAELDGDIKRLKARVSDLEEPNYDE